jgi:hypothetical protein
LRLFTAVIDLFWRAFRRAIRAENATIARFRLENDFTVAALIKVLARINRHIDFFDKAAVRTCQR